MTRPTGSRLAWVRRRVAAHRRLAAALLATGVAALCAAAVLSSPQASESDTGNQPLQQLVQEFTLSAPATLQVPIRNADLPAPPSTIAPVTLAIPGISVVTRVVPAGLDDEGEFSVPPSVDTVGWYRFGPGLGENTGSVVVGGHVDSAQSGPGAFFRLKELIPGMTIDVTGDDGKSRTYRIVAREQRPKNTIDLQPYFATTGVPRLTLFTCGGSFDRKARSYSDNIVVTAVLLMGG